MLAGGAWRRSAAEVPCGGNPARAADAIAQQAAGHVEPVEIDGEVSDAMINRPFDDVTADDLLQDVPF